MSSHAELIERYRTYGLTFENEEPLYAAVCRRLADFPDVVRLLAGHEPDAQQPNLLFAAVHYLILGGAEHELAEIYAGRSAESGARAFADFVATHRSEIDELLATQRTQTNEVGRASVLALMLQDAYVITEAPLAWIDLGASGGLNLNLDRFRATYHGQDRQHAIGPSDASVQITSELTGDWPPLQSEHAPITWRVGVDRSPVDVADETQARWLQACLWPSQHERQIRLGAAIDVARANPCRVVEADAAAGLRQALAEAPEDSTVVVTTTWVWYYLPVETRQQVLELMHQHRERVLWYSLEGVGVVDGLGANAVDVAKSVIGRLIFGRAAPTHSTLLGNAHPHGRWIDWHRPVP